jgi:hypothetical protein
MSAGHVDDFVAELKRLGEVAFRKRHRAPVLIVTGRATRGKRADTEEVTRLVSLKSSGKHRASLALVHRVFPLTKAPHAPAGPVVVGRTAENDVSIPEYSISKRHCAFEAMKDGLMTVSDCGSTNGTTLNGTPLERGVRVPLCGGERITMGRFTFVYETPAGFLEFVSGFVK